MRRRKLLRSNAGWALALALLNVLIAGGAAYAGAHGAAAASEKWTSAEIEAARADCGKRFSGLHVQFEALGPIKEGVCGTPAPFRLKGFE